MPATIMTRSAVATRGMFRPTAPASIPPKLASVSPASSCCSCPTPCGWPSTAGSQSGSESSSAAAGVSLASDATFDDSQASRSCAREWTRGLDALARRATGRPYSFAHRMAVLGDTPRWAAMLFQPINRSGSLSSAGWQLTGAICLRAPVFQGAVLLPNDAKSRHDVA